MNITLVYFIKNGVLKGSIFIKYIFFKDYGTCNTIQIKLFSGDKYMKLNCVFKTLEKNRSYF